MPSSTTRPRARASSGTLLLAVLALLLLVTPARAAVTATGDAATLGAAAVRDPEQMTGGSWDVAANANASAVSTTAMAGFPTHGDSFMVLSSGDATRAATTPQSGQTSVDNGGGIRGGAENVAVLKLNFTVPSGTNCITLKFRYLSEEFPEYVNQGYNDGFIAEVDPATPWTMTNHEIAAPDNFAFMPGNKFVSINSAAMSAENAAGTIYDGATELLSASKPVTPGAHSLVLSVWDDGDVNYDSAAFVDDIYIFNAAPGGCEEGAVAATPPADTTAPDTSLDTVPSGTTGPATSFAFSATEEDSTFECKLDDGDWATCTTPRALTGLTTGSHTFQVRATDAASNTDATPASHTWTVDATPPQAGFSGGPAALTNSTMATLGFTAGESGSTFECKLDHGAWATCASNRTFPGLAEGEHTVSVRATDPAGNTGPVATRTWRVDVTAPVPSVTSGPEPLVAVSTIGISFTSDDAGATLECRVDGSDWAPCTSPRNMIGLADGDHVLELRATDAAGNVSPVVTRNWTVDTTGPAAPEILAGPIGKIAPGVVRFALGQQPGASLFCRLDGGEWFLCPASLDLERLGLGDHVLEVRQVDAAGNTSPVVARRWTITAAAPADDEPAGTLTGSVGTTPGGKGGGSAPSRSGARPTAVVEGGQLPVGCSVDRGAIKRCTVEVRVAGKLVGTGTVAYEGRGTRSGRVDVKLDKRTRALLNRSTKGVKATFTFRATTVGGDTKPLVSRQTVTLAPRARWIMPSDGLFATSSARLSPQVHRYLRSIATGLRDARTVRCEGHTDARGGRKANVLLGFRRAKAVCSQLRRLGVDARLHAVSKGESEPRATNATPEGRWRNRRVELRILR